MCSEFQKQNLYDVQITFKMKLEIPQIFLEKNLSTFYLTLNHVISYKSHFLNQNLG